MRLRFVSSHGCLSRMGKMSKMKALSIAALLISSVFALGGEISDYHFKRARDTLSDDRKSVSHDEVESTNHGISEFGIERSGSVWGGPSYTFIVKSDGTFRYKGDRDVERT